MSGTSEVTTNELLIEKVRGYELLYNINLASYREPHIRQAAWEEIGRDINMKAELVRFTWDKLRRCFLNAIRRRNRNRTNRIMKGPVWKYEKQMSFLLPFIGKRMKMRKRIREEKDEDGIESIEEVNVNNCPEQLLEEDEPPNIKPEITKVAKTDVSGSSSFIEITREANIRCEGCESRGKEKEANIRCKDCESKEKDETDMFFLSMARTTKQLPVVEQAKIKLLLGNAVLRAQLKVNGDPNYQSYSSFENGAFYE